MDEISFVHPYETTIFRNDRKGKCEVPFLLVIPDHIDATVGLEKIVRDETDAMLARIKSRVPEWTRSD